MKNREQVSERYPLAGWTVAIFALLAGLLHLASYFVSDPLDALLDHHTEITGFGIYFADIGPIINATWMIDTLGVLHYLATIPVFVGMALISIALAEHGPFKRQTHRAITFFAWAVVFVGIQKIVFNALISITPPGFAAVESFALVVSYDQLLVVFIGSFLMVFANMMRRATSIAQEMSEFV